MYNICKEYIVALSFIKGLELNKGFYIDVVKPLLEKKYPDLVYSAVLLGYGSDVLGYDTEISMDHNWGPRLQLFIENKDIIPELDNYFRYELPFQYKNFSTNFTDPKYDGAQSMVYTEKCPVNHLIEIRAPQDYFKERYSINKLSKFTNDDWLTFTDQNLLETTSGMVFHDGLKINELRNELKFYPLDICKLRMAVLWDYIWNKEAFIGRSIEIDDYIGLKINTSRIINYLIKILFYLENKYIPYSKWLGNAFKELAVYNSIKGIIVDTLNENEPKEIEKSLCILYEKVVEEHNKNGKLPYLGNKINNFFGRPYKVIFAEKIVEALIGSIEDEKLKKIDLKKYAHDIIIDE
jgi:hypothetical protein